MVRVLGLLMLLLLPLLGDDLARIKAQFSKQDKALNEVYARLKKELGPEVFAEIRDAQRQWMSYRDMMSDRQAFEGEPEESVDRWDMATSLTEERTQWLAAWLTAAQREGWSGRYSDSHGGTLEIAEKEGKYWFRLSVVRGPTFHVGEIGGEFRVNGTTGWFEVIPEGEVDSTWLTFLDEGLRLRVVGENTGFFHGARAYFGGEYLWLGELTAEQQADLIAGKGSLDY